MGGCKETVHARACTGPPSMQRLLRKDRCGPRHKQAEIGAAYHSWHSRSSTKKEYKWKWTEKKNTLNPLTVKTERHKPNGLMEHD